MLGKIKCKIGEQQYDKPRIRVRDFVPGINSNHFNDFEQHEYDFDELEAKMLDN